MWNALMVSRTCNSRLTCEDKQMIHDIKITSNRSTLTAKTMGTHEQGVLTNNMRIDLESYPKVFEGININ